MTCYDWIFHGRLQFQRCTGGAGVSLSAKRKGYIMSDVTITYQGERVSVSREVADFLEQDRKHLEAQGRRDRRHLIQSEFEAAVNSQPQPQTQRALEDAALKNLQLEKLRKAVADLEDQDQQLISLRYDDELSMEEIGRLQNVSKMTISKRLKKLHQKLRDSVI